MKKLLAVFALALLAGCHQPENAPTPVASELDVIEPVENVLVAPAVSQEKTFSMIIDDIKKDSGVTVTPAELEIFVEAGARHGVHWRVLVAQWKMESTCGANMGRSNPLVVLQKFRDSTTQIAALQEICRKLKVDPASVKSGEAGELGPMQMRPKNFLMYGVDLNGDGKANPWDLKEAVNAAAVFLKMECRYQRGETPFGALAHYNGGWTRRWRNEHYANVNTRQAVEWGEDLAVFAN